jgi:tetratricopeptide (TPR) repeat protein
MPRRTFISTIVFFFAPLFFSPAPAATPAAQAEALNNLGAQYYEAGRYQEAEPLFRSARELVPAGDKLSGIVSNNLAALLGAEGRFREAEPIYHQAHAALKSPEDTREYAISLANLAESLRKQDRLAEAESTARRALGLIAKTLSPDDPHYADCLETLGSIERANGHPKEAGQYLSRALAIQEKAGESAAVGITLNNLAGLYTSQHRFAEAETAERRSIAILTKASGPDHPALAASLNGLAQALRLNSRYVEVEPLYRRALAILATRVGENHPDYARTLGNLADYYTQRHRSAEASALYRRSVDILTAAFGPAAPEVAAQRDRLAVADAALHHRRVPAPVRQATVGAAFAAAAPDNVAIP